MLHSSPLSLASTQVKALFINLYLSFFPSFSHYLYNLFKNPNHLVPRKAFQMLTMVVAWFLSLQYCSMTPKQNFEIVSLKVLYNKSHSYTSFSSCTKVSHTYVVYPSLFRCCTQLSASTMHISFYCD